jgi:hypothetical protein
MGVEHEYTKAPGRCVYFFGVSCFGQDGSRKEKFSAANFHDKSKKFVQIREIRAGVLNLLLKTEKPYLAKWRSAVIFIILF